MTENTGTEFQFKCVILADVWLNYRDDPEWEDFINYNDLGLPLAYMIANGIVEKENAAIGVPFVDEAFRLLLDGMGVEDLGFELFEDILEVSGKSVVEFGEYDEEEIEEEEESEPEEQSDWERDWDAGYGAGVKAEQLRVQQLCSTYTEMYLDMGKGQKAVLWREVADALKPVDDVAVTSNEEDGF